jgi:Pumilio-family RNA binding repeat
MSLPRRSKRPSNRWHNNDDLVLLVRELHGAVASRIHDQNGNHVIQMCVEVVGTRAVGDRDRALFMSQQMNFVLDAVLVNATMLSCHLYRCRVVQRILEHATMPETIILVLNEVVHKSRPINTDAIKIAIPLSKSGVTVEFCTWRAKTFASNVVEKALEAWQGGDQRHTIVREMVQVLQKNICLWGRFHDPYHIYIIVSVFTLSLVTN